VERARSRLNARVKPATRCANVKTITDKAWEEETIVRKGEGKWKNGVGEMNKDQCPGFFKLGFPPRPFSSEKIYTQLQITKLCFRPGRQCNTISPRGPVHWNRSMRTWGTRYETTVIWEISHRRHSLFSGLTGSNRPGWWNDKKILEKY